MRFVLELAAFLKIGTAREMLARMLADELGYWRIMYRLGRFGTHRDDYRAGIVASEAANAGRLAALANGAKLRGQPTTVATFFPQSAPRRSREERQAEVARRLKMWRAEWSGQRGEHENTSRAHHRGREAR